MIAAWGVKRDEQGASVLPINHYKITAWMKTFTDRLYCFYEFGEQRPGPWSCRLAG